MVPTVNQKENLMNDTANGALYALLRCPECVVPLERLNEREDLLCRSCGRTFPLVLGIPRFVHDQQYSSTFGYQWKRFHKLQLDSYNGTTFSRDRFFSVTGWKPEELKGKLVLDAGCGAGRFTEIAVQCGASVLSIDLSEAVEACKENLDGKSFLVCQASLYALPFSRGVFDYVFCIGVIQHTPDPLGVIKKLSALVKPGGQIALWIYERDWKTFVGTTGFKYFLRPVVKRLPLAAQLRFCKALVYVFFPFAQWFKTKGLFGRIVMRLLPISSAHLQDVPLTEQDFRSWVFLDTFDMYTPRYDQPQRFSEIESLLRDLGFTNITRNSHGGISISAVKG